MQEITQDYLKSILTYNHETGVFTWNEKDISHFQTKRAFSTWNKRYAGTIAGATNAMGYRHINIQGKFLRSNRLAWLYFYGVARRIWLTT